MPRRRSRGSRRGGGGSSNAPTSPRPVSRSREHHSKYKVVKQGEFSGGRSQTLPGRQMWLLKTMARRMEVDTSLIDSSLTYWENKTNIESQTGVELHLKHKRQEKAPTLPPRMIYTKADEAREWRDYERSFKNAGMEAGEVN